MRLGRKESVASSSAAPARPGQMGRLLANTRGNTIPLVAAALVPLLGVIGASVDIGSAYMVKSQLRAAVDAAVLAGGTVTGDTTRRNREIERYFRANFPDGYMGTTLTRFDITPEQAPDPADADIVNLRLEAAVTMPTHFLHIFGEKLASFDLEAKAEVATGRKVNALEAILVLDNTLSMSFSAGNGQTRIQALREAAKTFVDTVYAGDPDTHANIAIGMIPYTTSVNVGWLLKDQYVKKLPPFTDSKPSNSTPLRWAGCVEAAYTIQDISTPSTTMDDNAHDTHARTPGTGGVPLFMPQLSPPLLPDNLYNLGEELNVGIWKETIKTWYDSTTGLAMQDILDSNSDINPLKLRARYGSYNSSWKNYATESGSGKNKKTTYNWTSAQLWQPQSLTSPSPNADCPAEALPPKWGASPSSLKNWINTNNHAVKPGWGTHSNLGMAWAYRMLRAPHLFKDIVPNNPNGKPEVEAIILMTDGNIEYRNEEYDSLNLSDSQRKKKDAQGMDVRIGHGYYTAYRTPHEKALTSQLPTRDDIAETQMELRLLKVCEAARKDGIRVYTIAFKIDSNTKANHTREIYRTCATSPRYFFDTASPQSLKEAFRMIAVDLVQLHLVE